MNARELVGELQHQVSARGAFGDPIQVDGATLLPAMSVRSGAGAGGGERGGAGYGLRTRPVGVYVVREGKVTWRPAVDANRIIWRGQLIALTALTLRLVAPLLIARRVRSRWRRGVQALLPRWGHRRRGWMSRARWLHR